MKYLLTSRRAGKTTTLATGLYLRPDAYLIVATFIQKQQLVQSNPEVAGRILTAAEAQEIGFPPDAKIFIDDLSQVLALVFGHKIHSITDTPEAI